ncbi:hypothetical protein Patl_3202 [Paraglaciecola sp. T6c]|uniref:YjbF family lipoprotein n=1 Tax=Pseudoalteromonas atlantica (strain T6c / ATCC BAA-1087) TaxID=3042615 RepID=UPI00005C531B|nr:YjbF family lipoprotein [Paraglaciecola sp. T6c]ABG41708.1 hypothetical protein Patl_3202 [Paraglaciecola sp. T6c]
MHFKPLIIIFISVIALCSCGGTYHAYYETLKIALKEPKNASLSLDDVKVSKTDIMSVIRGDRPTAVMALAYLENGKHKWLSSDNALLVLEKGRIVRTIGFERDLLHVSNSFADPLKRSHHHLANQQWKMALDWENDEYGYPVTSTFGQPKSEALTILTKSIDSIRFTETLRFEAPSEYIQTKHEWHNYYWYEKTTGTLIKSKQTLSPLSEPIEMTYLSRIARLD